MRKTLVLATVLALGAIGGAALAHEEKRDCGAAGSATAVSADAMRTTIDALGYDVRRLTTDGACFKAAIVDRESGGRVKALFSAGTGELVRARLDH